MKLAQLVWFLNRDQWSVWKGAKYYKSQSFKKVHKFWKNWNFKNSFKSSIGNYARNVHTKFHEASSIGLVFKSGPLKRLKEFQRASKQASEKLFLQQNRQISKSQKIWTSPNFGMRFTALSSEWLGDSKSIGFLGVADREVLKKWRRKWRFSQTELVGYILPRAVGRFPPKFGRGGKGGRRPLSRSLDYKSPSFKNGHEVWKKKLRKISRFTWGIYIQRPR